MVDTQQPAGRGRVQPMSTIAALVGHSSRLTDIFGYWPSFHDAEVISLSLHRDAVVSPGPTLVAFIHVFEMTSEVSESGHFICRKHTLVDIQFSDVEDLKLEDFNHQNALNHLRILESTTRPGRLAVFLDSAYGLDGTFTSSAVEVLSATPGIPPGSIHARADARPGP